MTKFATKVHSINLLKIASSAWGSNMFISCILETFVNSVAGTYCLTEQVTIHAEMKYELTLLLFEEQQYFKFHAFQFEF